MARLKRILLVLVLAISGTALLSYIPTPYILRAPGRAQDVAQMIKTPDRATPSRSGKLLLTTVIYEPATALYCLYALLDPSAELLPQGPRRHETAAADLHDEQMDRSQYLAKVAALLYLGYQLQPQARGAMVTGLLPGSPAEKCLQPGDLIVEANGRTIRRADDLTDVVLALKGPQTVHLEVERQGKSERIDVETYQTSLGGQTRRLLGVQIRTDLALQEFPVSIDIQAGNVSGASAGLLFALGIVDRLGSNDLSRGRTIAGTGTIEAGGQVGPVVGASMKIVAAQRAGATVFLCPQENAAEARAAHTPLEVIPVATLRQAVEKLTAGGS